MNVTVESLPNCVTTLRLEVPSEKVKQTREAITNDFAKAAKLPGFRAGKAPRGVVETKYKKEIREELERKILDEATREAIKRENLRVISIQNVDEFEIDAEQTARITATVITSPQFEVPEYKNIPVTVPKDEITDEEVNQALEELRDRYADFSDVEGRAAQMEDYVIVDYTGTVDGKPLVEAFPKAGKRMGEDTGRWIRMTAESFFPGFCDQLVGANVGDERTVEVTVPEDFGLEEMRGQKLQFQVKVTGVKEKKVQELNDEFAGKVIEGKTLAEVRDVIREELKNRRTAEIDQAKRNQIMTYLLSKVECELPQHLVSSEAQRMLEEIVRENQGRGVTDEVIKENEQQLFGAAAAGARDRLKGTFILARIAEQEKLTVSADELKRRVAMMAMRYQMPFEKMLKELEKRNAFSGIHEEMLTGKALDFLVSNASVQTAEAAS